MPSVGQLVEVLKWPSKSGLRDRYLLVVVTQRFRLKVTAQRVKVSRPTPPSCLLSKAV